MVAAELVMPQEATPLRLGAGTTMGVVKVKFPEVESYVAAFVESTA